MISTPPQNHISENTSDFSQITHLDVLQEQPLDLFINKPWLISEKKV